MKLRASNFGTLRVATLAVPGIVLSMSLFISVLISVFMSPDDAHAQRKRKQLLCRDSSGKVFVATSCGRRNTPVNSTDLQGPPGNQGNQGSAGRGINDALAGGTSIRGAGGGMFVAPGANTDPWIVVVPFQAVLPTPLTADKILVAQNTLRPFCRDPLNVIASNVDMGNDCLRSTELLSGFIRNQLQKSGQFTTTSDNVCTGTAAAPTAPAGFVCIYLTDAKDFNLVYADTAPSQTGAEGFSLSWISQGGAIKSRMNFVWAYTAPAS